MRAMLPAAAAMPKPGRAMCWRVLMPLLCVVCLAWAGAAAGAGMCTVTLGTIAFGNIDVTQSTNNDLTTSLHAQCSGYSTAAVRLCLSLGVPAGGGTGDNRVLPGPSSPGLRYNLYLNTQRNTVWGSLYDTPSGVPMILDVPISGGTGEAWGPIYGRIPPNQTSVSPGTYAITFAPVDTEIDAFPYSSTIPTCNGTGYINDFTFQVTANVISNCSISARNMDFGTAGVNFSSHSTTGTLTVRCSAGTTYALSLNAGQGSGATFAARKLTRAGGTETLLYSLYTDPVQTQVWGDGTQGSMTVSGVGTGGDQAVTVYGLAPAQTSGPPGTYSDTIIVTVTY